MCATGSKQAEKEEAMYEDQEEKKEVNLGLWKGCGEEAMTTSVRKASDWLFKTGPESTHPRGAVRSATTRAGESGRRPHLVRRSTLLFISSLACTCVHENLSWPE